MANQAARESGRGSVSTTHQNWPESLGIGRDLELIFVLPCTKHKRPVLNFSSGVQNSYLYQCAVQIMWGLSDQLALSLLPGLLLDWGLGSALCYRLSPWRECNLLLLCLEGGSQLISHSLNLNFPTVPFRNSWLATGKNGRFQKGPAPWVWLSRCFLLHI